MSNKNRNPDTVEHRVTIRFPQVDPGGIVFYPRHFEMLFQYFPGLPFATMPFAICTEFLKPNKLGDRLTLARRQAPESTTWSFAGRMNGADHFTVRPMQNDMPELPLEAHRSVESAFRTAEQQIGHWNSGEQGQMHLSRYFEFLNCSIEELFERTLGLPFHELHVGRGIGIPTARFLTRCRGLPCVGESVAIWLRPTKIGKRALTVTSWLVRDGECLIENEQVLVFVRMLADGYESIAIPDDVRAAFATQMEAGRTRR